MRHIFNLVTTLTCLTPGFAQSISPNAQILASKQVTDLFPDTVLKRLNIHFPIVRVYKYFDKSGQYYCILTESRNEITADKDTINHEIKAVNVKADRGPFAKLWEVNDHIVTNYHEENSISFWTKYIEFKDFDNDGLIDPLIIYGTFGASGFDDGRIKFIVFYRNKKFAIRHQNGVLDYERETQVDKAFYDLPESLQKDIKQKIELMMKNNQAIFPAGWQTAMKNKKTSFNETRH